MSHLGSPMSHTDSAMSHKASQSIAPSCIWSCWLMLALEHDNVIRMSSELRRTCPQPLRLNSCCFHCVHNPCLICTMADPPSKRRRIEEAERQFIKIELFTMAGETVQSLWVPSTIHGRELLDLVLPAQAQHGSVAKLLHGVSAINKSAPIRLVHKVSPIVHS